MTTRDYTGYGRPDPDLYANRWTPTPKKDPTYSVGFTSTKAQRGLEVLAKASGQNRTYWATKAMEMFFEGVDVEKLATEYAAINTKRQAEIDALLQRTIYNRGVLEVEE